MSPKALRTVSVTVLTLAFTPAMSAGRAMRVAVLIDTSAATTSAIVQIRAAVAAFVDALPPEHELLLITTGRRTQVRVPPTTDHTKVKNSSAGMLTERGPTALMDSLVSVDERFMRKAEERWPVFVIITGDGSENSKERDEQGFNRWITDVSRRGVSVNAIVLKTLGLGLPESIASTLTQATRGHYVAMNIAGDIAHATAQLAAELTADADSRP